MNDGCIKYVIDECVPFGFHEIISKESIESKKLVPPGSSDDLVLEEATKRGLIVVTADIRFVLRTITHNQDIIFQSIKGERYYIHPQVTLLSEHAFKKCSKSTRYLLENEEIVIP